MALNYSGGASGGLAGAKLGGEVTAGNPYGIAIGGAVGALGGLLSGGGDSTSARAMDQQYNLGIMTQQINMDEAQKNREFNSAEAVKNRAFQQYNSDTAHRREMYDLEQAGLNPILAVTGGNGASSPSGAMAQGSPAHVQHPFDSLAADTNAARKIDEVDKARVALELTGLMQNIKKSNAEVENLAAQKENTEANTSFTKGVNTDRLQQEIKESISKTGGLDIDNFNKFYIGEKLVEEIRNLAKTRDEIESRINLNSATSAYHGALKDLNVKTIESMPNPEVTSAARTAKEVGEAGESFTGIFKDIMNGLKPSININKGKGVKP